MSSNATALPIATGHATTADTVALLTATRPAETRPGDTGSRVQRVPNQTRIDRLSASILRKALRWLAGRETSALRGYKQVIYQAAVAVDPEDPQRTIEAFIRVTLEVETVTTRNAPPAPESVFPNVVSFTQAERHELVAAAAKHAAAARLMTAQQAMLPAARLPAGGDARATP